MWRGYLLKEALREIFAGDIDEPAAGELLDRWCAWPSAADSSRS
ncbi:MAG: hypothetical protein ACRDZ6_11400 [Acidimicrobiales bacterium]